MRCCGAFIAIFNSVFLSFGAFAQCDSGVEARIEVEKIEAKPIPSVVANSSSGASFVINADSNQIDIVISNASVALIRNFTSRYSRCIVTVLVKKIPLESESVANLFPLSEEAGFTRYLGLTIPKRDYHLEYLKQVVDGEKSMVLKIK